jgi:hypothetical protein
MGEAAPPSPRCAFVFNFAQTPSMGGRTLISWDGGNGELPVNDAQRYRMNAVECLSAAAQCEPAYRGLTLAIAEAWLSLARQQEALDQLLVIWSEASAFTGPHRELPRAVGHVALQVACNAL